VKAVTRRIFRIIAISTLEERQKWLTQVSEIVTEAFPKA